MHLQLKKNLKSPGYSDSDWYNFPERAPLLYWPITDVPVNARQAFESGHSPGSP